MTTGTTPSNWFALSADESEQLRKQQERELDAEKCARIVLEANFSSYKKGEITLEQFMRKAYRGVNVEHMPGFLRQKLLGAWVERALAATPKPRRRSSKRSRTAWE